MQRNGHQNKEVWEMPTCYCQTFMCSHLVFPSFSVFKVVYDFTCSPSAMSVVS